MSSNADRVRRVMQLADEMRVDELVDLFTDDAVMEEIQAVIKADQDKIAERIKAYGELALNADQRAALEIITQSVDNYNQFVPKVNELLVKDQNTQAYGVLIDALPDLQGKSFKYAYRQHNPCVLKFLAYQFHAHLLGTGWCRIEGCNSNGVLGQGHRSLSIAPCRLRRLGCHAVLPRLPRGRASRFSTDWAPARPGKPGPSHHAPVCRNRALR